MSQNNGTMKVRAEIRLKNAKLVTLRESFGMKSGAFAKMVGIKPGTYSAYETMRQYPSRNHARILADLAGCEPDALFPDALHAFATDRKPRVLVSELEVSTDKLLAAGVQILELPESTTPEEMLHTAALGFEMTNRLDMLTRREKRIIEMCYGLNGKEELEMTEIGTLLNLTRSRVQQLRDQALRKIRANSSRIVAEIRDSGL